MKVFTPLISFLAASLPVLVSAGQNCKCQDDNGQYDALTATCCSSDPTILCIFPPAYFPGPNNQCSASGSNCIDSGAFVQCCKDHGVGGAFCWD
ncbi:hypothetical protein PspLS_00269 [Pyricularia sp. CBS 133598]|nr:hypothetical protein PspLS_00269 [Pyricularia sp. CBS 133598]